MGIDIKYEQLSQEIKDEIGKYHEKLVMGGSTASMEDSMNKWFETSFDQWMNARFASSEKNIRRHPRIDVELPIKVVDTLIEPVEGADPDLDLVGTIINISRGGLYFRSNRTFEPSSIVKVLIDMVKIDKELDQIEAVAMVVRCDEIDSGIFGIGLMFSSIYNEHKQTLDLFVFRNLAYFMNKQ
jgi:c-di-GMP-binding flagellar brake protein YcgR